jgi:hypothetical protein
MSGFAILWHSEARIFKLVGITLSRQVQIKSEFSQRFKGASDLPDN